MKRAIALASLLLSPALLQAQRYAFRQYGPADGLANQVIRTLAQDREGFLWVGTENGLFRYDGARFVRFGAEQGLEGRRVTSIHEGRDGVLWIGTCNGIYARTKGSRFETVNPGVPKDALGCSAIASAPDGTVFIHSFAGLFTAGRVIGGRYEFRNLHPSKSRSSEESPFGMEVEPDGTVWFGCDSNLCRYAAGKVAVLGYEAGLPADRWKAIFTDSSGTLWVRSARSIMMRPRGASGFIPLKEPRIPSSDFLSITPDRDGNLLVPSDYGLFMREGSGRWRQLTTNHGLSINGTSCALQDREGSIWIGTQGAGLSRRIGFGDWESWTRADGLTDDGIWQLKRDGAGTLWVGTGAGLSALQQDGKWQDWKNIGGTQAAVVRGVEVDREGGVWAGLAPGGLFRVVPARRSAQRFGREAGLESDYILALYLDSNNTLWAATQVGLFRCDNPGATARFARVHIPGSDAAEAFRRPLRDRYGRVWAPGMNGLAMLENGNWIRFTSKDGLRENRVGYLAEGPDGALWVGYYEDVGISRLWYDNGKLTLQHFSKANGLHSAGVVSLGSDARGRIWVGTDEGVDVFDGKRWRHYGQADGLIWDDCDGSSFLADPDGSVWIGTSRGLSHFRPGRGEQELPPPVAITEAAAGRNLLDLEAAATVAHGDRSVRIAFAGLSFLNEDAVRFRYRLEGFEQSWSDTRQREVRYPNLPAGSYVFQVTAASARGVWSPGQARFAFRVLPPWWQTWWAYTLLTLLCGLTVWSLWRWRMRTLIDRQRKLEQTVSQRTSEIATLLGEAQEASRLKSEFLANMSHEIRTPLNGVLGMTDLALRMSPDLEQREYLETALNSGKTLLSLLNDILDLSKIEAGRLEFDPIPFSVRECADQVRNTLAPEARRKGLRLECQIQADVPERLLGDPVRLRQVLLNIAGNAVKFTSHGSVLIHGDVESGQAEAVQLHLQVRDTGIGIPEQKQRLIFEPFRQADGSTTRTFGGTGLGLAISSRLVEMMGGRIWVESTPGEGSTFHFTAALKRAPSEIARAGTKAIVTQPVSPVVGSLDILLAEDNPVNQRLAMRLLEKQGHRVIVAGNGRQALAKWQEGSFDLVMLDVQMPEMDGLEVAAAIRASERETGGRVPILALTAYAMKGDREACLEAGMDEYVSKPIEPDELFGKVARLMQGARGDNPEDGVVALREG